jgi:hypothetical protein
MRYEPRAVEVPATGTGAQTDVREVHEKWLQVTGLTGLAATLNIEGSVDGANFLVLPVASFGADPAPDITADGLFEMPFTVAVVRIVRKVDGTPGTPTAVIGGRFSHG